jgi:uncharacterized SAM-binding protein YcdF (DUF218 family)
MKLLFKLLATPLCPLNFCMLLIAAGLVFIIMRRRAGLPLAVAGLAILYLVSTPVFSRLITRPFEAPYYPGATLPRDCSAIVVLGGSGVPMLPPRVFPEINEAGDRLLHAARLYKTGVAPRVITTGGTNVGTLHQKMTEAEHNAMLLREIGVDSSAIIMETRSKVTADHGPTIGAILDSLHLPKKIILVTSAAHMFRSEAVFRKWGYAVFPSATDFQSSIYAVEEIQDFFPVAGALHNVTAIVHELFGILGYKVMGKI